MRVLSGSAKGRKLVAPKGDDVRPTSDKVRGAIFNILWSAGVELEGARVLDLFAGTGALGIEALSRGAESATFVERDRRALEALARNLDACGFTERSSVITRDADSIQLGIPFGVVFVDPPYAIVKKSRVIAGLAELIAPGGIAVVEHADGAPPPLPEGLVATDERRYGSTAVTIYKRAGED